MEYRQLIASHQFRKQQLDNQQCAQRFDFIKQQKLDFRQFNSDLSQKKEDLRQVLEKEKLEWRVANQSKNGQKKKIFKSEDNFVNKKTHQQIEIKFNSKKSIETNNSRHLDLMDKVETLRDKLMSGKNKIEPEASKSVKRKCSDTITNIKKICSRPKTCVKSKLTEIGKKVSKKFNSYKFNIIFF